MKTNITLQKIKLWTKRKCDGSLMFPRVVAAHFNEINTFDNSIITENDILQINNHERNQLAKRK